MIVDEKNIISLIDHSFEIDFVNIKLTQNRTENPIIYSGSGTISQDENGILKLKLIHTYNNPAKEYGHLFVSQPLGQIIDRDMYFNLEAQSVAGDLWKASNIWIDSVPNISFPSVGLVINTSILEILNTDERSNEDDVIVVMYIPGHFSIPCNEKETLPNSGWILNTLVYSFDQMSFKFKKMDNYLYLKVKCSLNSSELIENRILASLSLIFGKNCNPICIKKYIGKSIQNRIRSVDLTESNNPLPPIIKYELNQFENLMIKYMNWSYKRDESKIVLGYWHKVNRAYQAGIDIAALSLTIAIEGLVKEFFLAHGNPDEEMFGAIKDARKLIEESELIKRIADSIINSLNLLIKPSPKNALYSLSRQGYLPKEFIKQWQHLRNKTAHADQINTEKVELQKYIDEFHICLNLFYRLILLIISYEGKLIDHSQAGWPEIDLKKTK